LEAFEQFFRACPADTGMVFVLVPHLDPGHDSLLTEILQRCTAMPVAEAQDQAVVEPDHIYIIPPNREMALLNGALQLSVPTLARGQRMPIDAFFRSLAADQEQAAIGIVLSGTATDGTLGLRAIHGAGGVCMVQEPATAKYDGMPQSVIAAGYATHILALDKMPRMLLELVRQSVFRQRVPRILPATDVSGLNQILLQVRSSTGHDFSLYKQSTIGRRIERRMAQHNIDDMAVYARFLKSHPPEVQALFKELLINVTSFFRDPEAFAVLKQEVLPGLLANKPEDYVFRVWVAGCASGEEAYSIAMLLRELMDESHKEFRVQIYATDLDDDVIVQARGGSYPLNIAQDVSAERLRRFFTKDEHGYKVKKVIREMVVFAVQSVIKDPPFTKLDLLSCRNLMIYLEPEQQARLIPSFHYAIKPGGVLFLSSSESITTHTELFTALNRKWKLFRANPTASVIPLPALGRAPAPELVGGPPGKLVASKHKVSNIADLSNRVLLQSYAPASVTTDASGNVLYVHGDTSRYLRSPPGPVTTNVIEMAREGLQLDLRAAILNTVSQGSATLAREVSMKTDTGLATVRFSVRLLSAPASGAQPAQTLLLVSFQEVADAPKPAARSARGKPAPDAAAQSHAQHLERELAYAKEYLQATIEEQQATNEELKSTNEELQSTNEELQSSNEELETSKEELQSLNEETITVNAELHAKIEQLNGVQNDLKNLLDNVNTGALFLDHDLVIRRFTREAVRTYRLIASDVGRPLGDIKSNFEAEDLMGELQSVLDTLIPREREVRTQDGAWYLARMQPYRTLDNVIEGVVLTFTDITALHEAERLRLGVAQVARELAEGIVNTVSEPLIVLDGGLKVVSASRTFYQHFRVNPEETVGRKIYDLGDGQWDIAALRELLDNILPKDQVMDGYVVEHRFPGLGLRRMVLNARRIVTALGNTELILLAMVALETLEPV
ncbi:CheR family methyltransferase, partial [Rhodoferax sp.]|uniref:CheR family methyltransferase n=1 Tax=Rhodoferax sp. TaxID=50421 RepID=UPI002753A33E|nr:CheR family methyltransferase [Rhodoferax sp.]